MGRALARILTVIMVAAVMATLIGVFNMPMGHGGLAPGDYLSFP